MSGISTKAPLKLENRFKFNGKELNHKEFGDGAGLEWYDYKRRVYDPQIGRFGQVDALADNFPFWTPYQFTGNNPVKYVDLDGMEPAYYDIQTNTLVLAGDHLTHNVPQEDLQYLPSGLGGAERAVTDYIVIGVAVAAVAAPEYARVILKGAKNLIKRLNNAKSVEKQAKAKVEKGSRRFSNKLKPDENATGNHSTFKRDNNGNIHKYETYEKTKTGHNNPVKRFDGGTKDGKPGAPYRNKTTGEDIPTPICMTLTPLGKSDSLTPMNFPIIIDSGKLTYLLIIITYDERHIWMATGMV